MSIDFGLARALGAPGSGDAININMCGTLEFMSPEVMRCSHASPASDMWSTGVILYFLVSAGLSPFWGGTEYRTQRNVLRYVNFGNFWRLLTAIGNFWQTFCVHVIPQIICEKVTTL